MYKPLTPSLDHQAKTVPETLLLLSRCVRVGSKLPLLVNVFAFAFFAVQVVCSFVFLVVHQMTNVQRRIVVVVMVEYPQLRPRLNTPPPDAM